GGQSGMTLPNVATRTVSDLGLTVGSIGMFPAMDVVRQALPMILSFLKMAMVICIPLVLIFGTYDLRTVVTVTAVQFSLFFVDFWFQLARWIDSTILNALYGWHSPHSNFNPLMGLNNAFGDMLLNFVMATMFIILPGFWVVALTWAGVRTGNILGGFISGTTDAKSAGSSGSRLPVAAAPKGPARSGGLPGRVEQSRVVGIAQVDAPVVLVVDAGTRMTVPEFRLLLFIQVGVAHKPGGEQREREQQGQPERCVQQHAEHDELHDPEQQPCYAGRQSFA